MSNDEEGLGVHCNDCGEEAYLNPENGLCFDCELEAGLDEEEGDEDEDLEVCTSCGRKASLSDEFLCEDCEEDE